MSSQPSPRLEKTLEVLKDLNEVLRQLGGNPEFGFAYTSVLYAKQEIVFLTSELVHGELNVKAMKEEVEGMRWALNMALMWNEQVDPSELHRAAINEVEEDDE